MSVQEKNFFTILEKKDDSNFRIQENVPESTEQLIEISKSSKAKDPDGNPAVLYKTTQGRKFARLDKWPQELLMELKS